MAQIVHSGFWTGSGSRKETVCLDRRDFVPHGESFFGRPPKKTRADELGLSFFKNEWADTRAGLAERLLGRFNAHHKSSPFHNCFLEHGLGRSDQPADRRINVCECVRAIIFQKCKSEWPITKRTFVSVFIRRYFAVFYGIFWGPFGGHSFFLHARPLEREIYSSSKKSKNISLSLNPSPSFCWLSLEIPRGIEGGVR